MDGRFYSSDMKFIESNFVGPEISITEMFLPEEMAACKRFGGESGRLKRNIASYLSMKKNIYHS